jgi:hypothetical protein
MVALKPTLENATCDRLVLVVLPCDVALPVVVDVTSGRFYPLILGASKLKTIVLTNLWK